MNYIIIIMLSSCHGQNNYHEQQYMRVLNDEYDLKIIKKNY